jgi:hypothetical protein
MQALYGFQSFESAFSRALAGQQAFQLASRRSVQRYIHQKLLSEFMNRQFIGPRKELVFHGGAVVEGGASRRGPREQRPGLAFVLALRPWKYSEFGQFELGQVIRKFM